MDSKEFGIGALVMTFVAIIVALSLLSGSGGIASNVASATNVQHWDNKTVTLGAVGVGVELPAKVLIGTLQCGNFTLGDTDCLAGNYSTYTGVGAAGTKNVFIKAVSAGYAAQKVNLTGDYGGQGYAEEESTRSLAPIIIILAVLAIAVIVLIPIVKGPLSELVD